MLLESQWYGTGRESGSTPKCHESDTGTLTHRTDVKYSLLYGQRKNKNGQGVEDLILKLRKKIMIYVGVARPN